MTLYRPAQADGPLPVLLHIHGGGYLFGSAAGSGPANVRTASELQYVVAAVDYRLAPETRAPGAVEDCYAVLAWLHRNADTLGIDRDRIAVGGESAGGGLAAALALLARDRGEYPALLPDAHLSDARRPHRSAGRTSIRMSAISSGSRSIMCSAGAPIWA